MSSRFTRYLDSAYARGRPADIARLEHKRPWTFGRTVGHQGLSGIDYGSGQDDSQVDSGDRFHEDSGFNDDSLTTVLHARRDFATSAYEPMTFIGDPVLGCSVLILESESA